PSTRRGPTRRPSHQTPAPLASGVERCGAAVGGELAAPRPAMTKTSPIRRCLTYPEASRDDRLTHYLFRYPAKFHAPVVRQLVRDYTAKGDLIYDRFCGSGTLLVEALVEGRSAIGSDVDPVAVLVSQVKSRPIRKERLLSDLEQIQAVLAPHRRSP